MARLLTWTGWFLVITLVLAPGSYVLAFRPDASFWADVASGALSTSAALIAGIPIALWIDRHIKRKELIEATASQRLKELELLELLKEELEFCLNGLALRVPQFVEIQPLKSDLWGAAAAAGKLNAIRSHRLLNRIASAYYVINVVREIEKRGYVALRGATITFNNGQTAVQQVWADARRFDGLLRDSIAEAIKDIDADTAKRS